MDKIKNAIISVYEKNELENLAKELEKNDISIISSGGTFQALQKAGIKAQRVSDLTQFPEILDGRVKTLHPNIFGGILAKRKADHLKQLEDQDINLIDLVIVNLYPFESSFEPYRKHQEREVGLLEPDILSRIGERFKLGGEDVDLV